jgi:hypothetical protein
LSAGDVDLNYLHFLPTIHGYGKYRIAATYRHSRNAETIWKPIRRARFLAVAIIVMFFTAPALSSFRRPVQRWIGSIDDASFQAAYLPAEIPEGLPVFAHNGYRR